MLIIELNTSLTPPKITNLLNAHIKCKYRDVLILLIRSAAKFYPISKKNLEQKLWKFSKLEILSENFSRFFEIFDIFENFWFFRKFSIGSPIDIFRKNRKFSKISKISKNLEFFSESVSNFFHFQRKSSRFFFEIG